MAAHIFYKGQKIVIEGGGLVGGEEETVTSGALALNKSLHLISVTGTQAYTLADGTYVGQRKTLVCTVAASTPDGSVQPTNLAGFTDITFDAVGETAELIWDGTNWNALVQGATLA
jgi:hypothetical protein